MYVYDFVYDDEGNKTDTILLHSTSNYHKSDIEKTVNVFDNSVVEPGDTMTYSIKVTNNSNSKVFADNAVTYSDIEIIDYIQVNLLEGPDGKTTINYN